MYVCGYVCVIFVRKIHIIVLILYFVSAELVKLFYILLKPVSVNIDLSFQTIYKSGKSHIGGWLFIYSWYRSCLLINDAMVAGFGIEDVTDPVTDFVNVDEIVRTSEAKYALDPGHKTCSEISGLSPLNMISIFVWSIGLYIIPDIGCFLHG